MKIWKAVLVGAISVMAGFVAGIAAANGISKEIDKIFIGNLNDKLPIDNNIGQ